MVYDLMPHCSREKIRLILYIGLVRFMRVGGVVVHCIAGAQNAVKDIISIG